MFQVEHVSVTLSGTLNMFQVEHVSVTSELHIDEPAVRR